MMKTQDIPSAEWTQFIDQFGRDHAGWSATIEVLNPESGPQHLVEHLPFQGMSFDTSGTRPSSLEISAGDAASGLISHVIDLPMHIMLASDDASPALTLQIEPARGPRILLELIPPA